MTTFTKSMITYLCMYTYINIHVYIKILHLRHRVDNGSETIDENDKSNNGGREKPGCVETNPSEVDTNLLTKVTPVAY